MRLSASKILSKLRGRAISFRKLSFSKILSKLYGLAIFRSLLTNSQPITFKEVIILKQGQQNPDLGTQELNKSYERLQPNMDVYIAELQASFVSKGVPESLFSAAILHAFNVQPALLDKVSGLVDYFVSTNSKSVGVHTINEKIENVTIIKKIENAITELEMPNNDVTSEGFSAACEELRRIRANLGDDLLNDDDSIARCANRIIESAEEKVGAMLDVLTKIEIKNALKVWKERLEGSAPSVSTRRSAALESTSTHQERSGNSQEGDPATETDLQRRP